MTHEIFPQYFLPFDRTARFKRLLAHKAARIIAISENTKKDLIDIYGVSAEKVDVVYLAIADSWGRGGVSSDALCLPERYVLFIGKRKGYKNFDLLVRGLAPVLKDDQGLFLVCVGGGGFSSAEKVLLAQLGLGGRVLNIPFVSDPALKEMYKRAQLFVFPSRYEGFGFPILEAFSSGCPVVLSRASCFPEIARDAAEYFDLTVPEVIEEVVRKVLCDKERRYAMIERGRKRCGDFSWSKAAAETLNVYNKAIRNL
jgi:glycosyltransferase involved in cell wall biosynthesis